MLAKNCSKHKKLCKQQQMYVTCKSIAMKLTDKMTTHIKD